MNANAPGWKKKQEPPRFDWARLTWDQIEAWTDLRSIKRGKKYHRQGRVLDLALTKSGELVAWVQGGKRYAVKVELTADGAVLDLDSECTCPVVVGCKHAVAAVVAYLEALAAAKSIPVVGADDPRLRQLNDDGSEDEFGDDDDEYLDDEEQEEDEFERPSRRAVPAPRTRGNRQGNKPDLRGYLQGQTARAARRARAGPGRRARGCWKGAPRPGVLASGNENQLLKAARAELRKVASEDSWWNHWERTGHLPDYGPLRGKLERLLEAGMANHLLPLGVDLLERGKTQIEQGHDEGETADDIRQCLDVIFECLPNAVSATRRKCSSPPMLRCWTTTNCAAGRTKFSIGPGRRNPGPRSRTSCSSGWRSIRRRKIGTIGATVSRLRLATPWNPRDARARFCRSGKPRPAARTNTGHWWIVCSPNGSLTTPNAGFAKA